jgi:hypothetical protein
VERGVMMECYLVGNSEETQRNECYSDTSLTENPSSKQPRQILWLGGENAMSSQLSYGMMKRE